MDFERGYDITAKSSEEISPVEKTLRKNSSYSEEEQAKVIEGNTIDIKQIGTKRKTITVSKKEKIMGLYRENLEKIFRLVEAISLLDGKNYRQEEQLLEEIKRLRKLQEELLNALILEQKGGLDARSVSKEIWDLIG